MMRYAYLQIAPTITRNGNLSFIVLCMFGVISNFVISFLLTQEIVYTHATLGTNTRREILRHILQCFSEDELKLRLLR